MIEMLDRGQIKRDAEKELRYDDALANHHLARHCLALLAALEQAERERDEALLKLRSFSEEDSWADLEDAKARLAKVPALVEALEKHIADCCSTPITGQQIRTHDALVDALADYEGE